MVVHQAMKTSIWLGLAAAAVAAAVAAFLLYPGGGRQEGVAGREGPAAGAAAGSKPVTGSNPVYDRLQQLSEARAARARGEGDGPNEPSGRIDAGTGLGMKRDFAPREAPAARPPAEAPEHDVQAGALVDPQPEDIPTLKTMALQDADPQRRLAAVTLLGASDDPNVIPVLAQALSDQDEDVRMAAIQSLADFTGEAPVDAIESALNDSSPDVRYEALEVLSDIGGERARRAVQRALNDPDEDVQELAQSILEFDFEEDQNQ
jgi:hypothetical protein